MAGTASPARAHRARAIGRAVTDAIRGFWSPSVLGPDPSTAATCEPLERRVLLSDGQWSYADSSPLHCPRPFSNGTYSCNCDPPGKMPQENPNSGDGGQGPQSVTQGPPPPETSSLAPVRYFDGVPDVSATDLSSDAFGKGWGQSRQWSPALASGPLGPGWDIVQLTHLVNVKTDGLNDPTNLRADDTPPTSTLAVAVSGLDIRFFDSFDTNSPHSYTERGGNHDTLVDNGTDIVMTDTTGGQTHFYRYTSSPMDGMFKSYSDAYGNTTTTNYNTTNGELLSVNRSNGHVQEQWVFTYTTINSVNQISSVTLQRSADNGSTWTAARSVSYDYYGAGAAGGPQGYLKTVTIKDGRADTGTTTDIWGYRYFISGDPTPGGSPGDLKTVLDPRSYALAVNAGLDPTTATDSALQPYATNYFKYNANDQISWELAQGDGCSCSGATGQGIFTYAYSKNPNAQTSGPYTVNAWTNRTVVGLPDGSQDVIYTNAYAQTMLKLSQQLAAALNITSIANVSGNTFQANVSNTFAVGDVVVIRGSGTANDDGTYIVTAIDGTNHAWFQVTIPGGSATSASGITAQKVTQQWGWYYKYGELDSLNVTDSLAGRLVMSADPSAVTIPINFSAIGSAGTSLDQSYADLVNYTGFAQYLNTSAGLIADYSYGLGILPADFGWVMHPGTTIVTLHSPLLGGLPPHSGNAAASLQATPGNPVGPEICQWVYFHCNGPHSLSFYFVQFPDITGSDEQIEVLVDGSVVGTVSGGSGSWQSSGSINLGTLVGWHEICLQGYLPPGGTPGSGAFIDDVTSDEVLVDGGFESPHLSNSP